MCGVFFYLWETVWTKQTSRELIADVINMFRMVEVDDTIKSPLATFIKRGENLNSGFAVATIGI